MADDYLVRIGKLIRDARQHRGWTQAQLAEALGTSQSAVNRIERGNQNISLEMIARIGEALESEIVSLGYAGPMHLRVVGGRRLSGAIDVKTSKNACVALLCASLLNQGRTVLRRVARIEEVYRLLEVLSSIGVRARWINDGVRFGSRINRSWPLATARSIGFRRDRLRLEVANRRCHWHRRHWRRLEM